MKETRGGHNIVSIEEKLAKGTYNATRDAHRLPLLPGDLVDVPPTPKGLRIKGKRIWKGLCESLIELSALREMDLYDLEILVVNLDTYWETVSQIRKYERRYGGIAGMDKDQIQQWKIMQSGAKLMMTIIQDGTKSFGLNPRARKTLLMKAMTRPAVSRLDMEDDYTPIEDLKG